MSTRDEKEKELEVIAYKINTDKKYGEQMFADYDFAKKEFSLAGIDIDRNSHQQLMNGHKNLNDAAARAFASGPFSKGTKPTTEVSVTVSVKF
jgi:hypothetical protein